jgi:hypothetical protein
MIGACKPTVPLIDGAVDVLSKDNYKAGRCSVVLHDTLTTPLPCHTLPQRNLNLTFLPLLDALQKDIINPAK